MGEWVRGGFGEEKEQELSSTDYTDLRRLRAGTFVFKSHLKGNCNI